MIYFHHSLLSLCIFQVIAHLIHSMTVKMPTCCVSSLSKFMASNMMWGFSLALAQNFNSKENYFSLCAISMKCHNLVFRCLQGFSFHIWAMNWIQKTLTWIKTKNQSLKSPLFKCMNIGRSSRFHTWSSFVLFICSKFTYSILKMRNELILT